MPNEVQIPARLKNVSFNDPYVASVEDIIDDNAGQTQQEINRAIVDKPYSSADHSGMGRVNLPKNLVNIAEEGEEENVVNLLTQDMLFKGEPGSREPNTNTAFVIQYDYTLGEIKKEDVTIDGESSTEISDTTYYYTTVELEAGKCLRLLDVEHCVLLEDTTALLNKEEVMATEDTTVYIASTTADTYTEAYSIENVITIPANCTLDFQGGSIKNGTVVLNDTVLSGEANFRDVAINGFFRRENFSQRPCFYLEDFGGKVNDDTVDCSPALEKAINAAAEVGGIVKFNKGRYYFYTPVVTVDKRLESIEIVGSSTFNDRDNYKTDGSVLVWLGEGWLLTVPNKVILSSFRNFTVLCNYENNGIRFMLKLSQVIIENICIYNYINGLYIGGSAYLILRWLTITSFDNSNVETALEFGSQTDTGNHTLEYVWIYNTNIQSSASYGTGVKIHTPRHFAMKDCDIAGQACAIEFDSPESSRFVKIEDVDITRCIGGIHVVLMGHSMSYCSFHDVVYIASENLDSNHYVMKVERPTAPGDMKNSVIDISVVKMGDTPTNILVSANFLLGANSIFNFSGDGCDNAAAFPAMAPSNGGSVCIKTRPFEAIACEIKGNGTDTTTSIELGPDLYSGFSYPLTVPCIVQDLNDNIQSHALRRDNGILYVDITFKAAFSNRNYITIYCPQIFKHIKFDL